MWIVEFNFKFISSILFDWISMICYWQMLHCTAKFEASFRNVHIKCSFIVLFWTMELFRILYWCQLLSVFEYFVILFFFQFKSVFGRTRVYCLSLTKELPILWLFPILLSAATFMWHWIQQSNLIVSLAYFLVPNSLQICYKNFLHFYLRRTSS